MTSIGDSAFSGCTSLTSADLSAASGLTSIGGYAFERCTNLESVKLPEGLTSIESGAFQSCSGLQSITLPASLTKIETSAFKNCTGLTSLTFLSETPPTLGSSALDSTSTSLQIYVPDSAVNAYKNATDWSTYAGKISANPVYTVTVQTDGSGTASASATSAVEGTEITLAATPNDGYRFVEWQVVSGGVTITNNQFTMPDADVTVKAVFAVERPYVPPANPNYRVDIPTPENGAVTADPAAAKAGETVTLTPAPEEGYEVGEIIVTDRFGDAVAVTENPDGTYTFTMPSGQVRVEVTFVEATPEPLPFTDVKEDDWFHDAVRYVYDNGLMDGVGDGQFAPNATTNRAMVVTILYRLAGEPAVSGDVGFADVAAGQWYTNAVLWAAQKGIVNGISETEFSPSGDLTREQLATILYRYAQDQGYDVSASADLSSFPDAGDIQSYATQALSWAVAQGLLQGFEDDSLQPQATATRAQIATILMRFCETVAE